MASIDVFKQEVVINWFYIGYGNYTSEVSIWSLLDDDYLTRIHKTQDFTGDYLLNQDLEVYYNGNDEAAGTFIASHESVYVTQTFTTTVGVSQYNQIQQLFTKFTPSIAQAHVWISSVRPPL